MINWNFNPDEVEERNYAPLPVGDYRVRIEDVEEGQGKWPYYKLTLKVNRDNRKLWYYLSFMDGANSKITNTNLANIWNSFNIKPGDMDYRNWFGKVGAVRVKHEMYNGEPSAKVAYFIPRDRQDKLPEWEEESYSKIDNDFTLLVDDDNIPF